MAKRDLLKQRILAVIVPASGLLTGVSSCTEDPGVPGGTTGVSGAPATSGTGGTLGTGIGGTQAVGGGGSGAVSGANCTANDVGTCCDHEQCFTPEELEQFLRTHGGGMGGAGAGGMAGSDSAGVGGEGPQNSCSVITHGWLCGWFTSAPPVERDGKCCYVIRSGGCCGRPFIVQGAARQSPLSDTADWYDRDPAPRAGLRGSERRTLATAWAADALLEHASVASFARFTLELLAIGAPAELVLAAQQAGLDEVRHARACFSLAAGFADQPLGPGALDIKDMVLGTTLGELAVLAVREGCVGETLAAALASEQFAVCGDAECREVLDQIARDEAEHALLAWRFVKYAIEQGGSEVVQAVRAAFIVARGTNSVSDIGGEVAAETWNHFGRLLPDQQATVIEETWRTVIEPAVSALLGDDESLLAVA